MGKLASCFISVFLSLLLRVVGTEELNPSLSHPIILVIDSLDECKEVLVPELILLLSELVHACRFLRIFITNCGMSHIQRRFADINAAAVTRRQELQTYNASNDIRLFLRRLMFTQAAESLALRFPA